MRTPTAGTTMFRPRIRSRLIAVVPVGLLAGLIAWYVGMDTIHAVGIGAAFFVACVVWISLPASDPTGWEPQEPVLPVGARQDVVRTSWLLHTKRGLVGDGGQRRVREIARVRLARRGLDLDDPAAGQAISSLIGADNYRIVRPKDRAMTTLGGLSHCLDVLDRIDDQKRAGQ